MNHKMIFRWVLRAAVMFAAFALVTGVALARTGGGSRLGAVGNHSLTGTMDQLDATMLSGGRYQLTNATLSGPIDQPDETTLSGGHYHLTTGSPGDAHGDAHQDSDLASGGGYHLKALASPQLTGTACCCNYLPCVSR